MNLKANIPGLVIATLLFAVPANGQSSRESAQDFLRKYLNASDAEIASLEQGGTVTRLPATSEPREIATLGAVLVNATKATYLSRFRDIVNFKKSSNVLQVGVFHNPARLDDLRGLTLDEADIELMRTCRAGNCGVKLPAKVIERLQKEIDWSASDYRPRVEQLLKQSLLEYVVQYQKGGNAALGEYSDQPYPLRIADEFRGILKESTFLSDYAPEFHRYLEQYPKAQLAGVENFIYWSKEKFGLRPVISLTHVTIYSRNQGKGSVLIASKQIYASHYFEASLGLTALVDKPGGSGFYLTYLNRSRADALRGSLAGMKRSLISRELLSGTESNLQMVKRRIEASGK